MKNWIGVLILVSGLGLALPQSLMSFTTRGGHQALATLLDQRISVQVVGQPYTLQIQIAGMAGLPNRNILAGLVDMVVLWAQSTRVSDGFSGCVLEVAADLFPDGTLSQVGVKDCAGTPVTMLYLLYLPQEAEVG